MSESLCNAYQETHHVLPPFNTAFYLAAYRSRGLTNSLPSSWAPWLFHNNQDLGCLIRSQDLSLCLIDSNSQALLSPALCTS